MAYPRKYFTEQERLDAHRKQSLKSSLAAQARNRAYVIGGRGCEVCGKTEGTLYVSPIVFYTAKWHVIERARYTTRVFCSVHHRREVVKNCKAKRMKKLEKALESGRFSGLVNTIHRESVDK